MMHAIVTETVWNLKRLLLRLNGKEAGLDERRNTKHFKAVVP